MQEISKKTANNFFGQSMDVLNYFKNVKGFEFGISTNAKVTPKYFTRQYALEVLNDRVVVPKTSDLL